MTLVAGAETRVNTFTTGDQRNQKIALLDDGGWIVTWQSSSQDTGGNMGVYFQRYDASGNPVGGETHVNTYETSTQGDPRVVALDTGGWVIAWESHGQDQQVGEDPSSGVYQQAYAANGTKVGAEEHVSVATEYTQNAPYIVALPGGRWVTSWLSQEVADPGSNPFGILRDYLRIYDANGSPATGELPISSTISGTQSRPAIVSLGADGFVVVWSTGGLGTTVYQQIYSNAGAITHDTEKVNTFDPYNQTDVRIAALKGGGYVVTWTSLAQDGSGSGIYQQAYNNNGSPHGSETQVHTTTADNQSNARVVPLESGGWVVLWQSASSGIHVNTLYQQAFNSDGSKLGSETALVGPTTLIGQHVITPLTGGGWVVTWNQTDGTGGGVMMQVFDANGTKAGGVEQVNVFTTADQGLDASVVGQDQVKTVALDDGGWVITWISHTQDGDGYGVYQRVYHLQAPVGAPPTDIPGKVKWTEGTKGTVGTLHATDADDTTGFTWSLLDDAGGRFKIDAATGKVTVAKPILLDFEQAKTHSITVKVTDGDGNSFTKVLSAKGTDVAMEELTLTAKADKVFGGSKVDTFNGGKGDDTIRGGGGKDVLDGGKGKDTADYSDKTKPVEVTLNTSKAVTVNVDGKAEDSIRNFENLLGGSKADKLSGDSASNVLDGNGGKDVLKGNGGQDFFVFDTALAAGNVDTIADFKAKDDTIRLDHTIFTALGTGPLAADAFAANATGNAGDDNDRIVYQKTTGKLFYDADGDGAGTRQLFAVLTDHPKLTVADFEII